jgi:hypothetical protein
MSRKKPDYTAQTHEELQSIFDRLARNVLTIGESVRVKFVEAPGLWEVYLK